MPQMMPLMWAPLFILFSLTLGLSFLKIYFSSNKFLSKTESLKDLEHSSEKISWLW
uniref:ATP synthase F0 subunit 8 n=1 Tax=Homidia sp. TaxID=3054010 RepID=A0AAU6PTG2_9HEXA